MRRFSRAVVLLAAVALAGCEDKPKTNPFENPQAPKAPPPITEPPKPQGPPDFVIAADGPKVGWTSIAIEKPDGPKKLVEEVMANKEHVDGKTVAVRVDRNANRKWVGQMIGALADAGASDVEITTETRTEYPKKVRFVPVSRATGAPGCTPVAKVLEDRRNAVWTLGGGTAIRSPRGLAGPDMAMTAENLTRAVKGCKGSEYVFVSGDDGVEWGLVYDLAACTQTLGEDKPTKVVLLPEPPTAGRAVAP